MLSEVIDVERDDVTGLGPGDWQILRTARLAALTDSPESFGATVADEAAWEPDRWIRGLHEARWGVVMDGESPVGLVGVRLASDVPDCDCWISSWWVAPRMRGAGVSDALLAWIDALCRAQAWPRQGLGVWLENDTAQRAFARLGFAPEGGPRDSTHFPGRRYVRMLRTIDSVA